MDFSHEEDDIELLFTEIQIILNEFQLKGAGFN